MAITQGTFDIVFGAIKSTLETYNSTQAPADQFTLYADYYRQLPSSASGAMVFLYLGSIVPTERTTLGYTEYDVTYYIDMMVKAKGQDSAVYLRADDASGIRFRLLVQQCLSALIDSDNLNFGLAEGTIGKKEIRIDPLAPEQQYFEQMTSAGRMTLTASMCYKPSDIEGIDLDSIKITADKWEAVIEP